jgi:hypothetical protein
MTCGIVKAFLTTECAMAIDPALAADTCTYMEAVAGDGGVHDPAGVWWLSPDIQLIGSASGADKADPGVDNTIDVTFHSAAGTTCTLPAGTESLTIDVWVANPSLAMAPNNSASTAHIDSIGMPLLPPGGSVTHQFHWVPALGLPASDPQAPGHKCLIARCYADPLIPSATSFFAPDDRHVAQHNICIVPCGGPGAAKRPAGCTLDVTTVNPDVRKPQRTRLRATIDLNPSAAVREVVLKRLKNTKGFGRLSSTPPRRFELRLREFPKAKVTDDTKGGGSKRPPTYEAEITLEPAQVIALRFAADLSGAKLGDAYIFHLTQAGPEGQSQGGLTVVMMAI